ncbi:MAG: penicillin-binding protein [Flavobacteriales bacterium]|nr:MAG: penicillin-binding protein [Flavobacteriales bacterium]
MRKIIFSLFTISSVLSFGQDGTSIYTFLNTPVSARQSALGGDAMSVRDDDVSFSAVNPSLLNVKMHNQISVDVASYIAGTKYGTINYARDLKQGHLMSINAKYMDYGKMDRTDIDGFKNGEFKAVDACLGVGYAYQFEDDWTVGTQLNYVNSKIDNYTSSAITSQFAITYHNKKRNETLALSMRNFGFQLSSYNGEKEKLPFRIDLGYTRILDKFPVALTVTAHNLQKLNISSEYDRDNKKIGFARKVFDHISFGVELFPKKSFNIRLGYNAKRGNELSITDQRNFTGISAGFGVKFANVKINYAHTRYHNATNVNMLGIGINLSGNKK